jgi:hypothetical protein
VELALKQRHPDDAEDQKDEEPQEEDVDNVVKGLRYRLLRSRFVYLLV